MRGWARGGRAAAAADFFNTRPIELSVVEGSTVTRQVGLLLSLELSEGHRKSEVSKKDREIIDAFITELYRIYGWCSGAMRWSTRR